MEGVDQPSTVHSRDMLESLVCSFVWVMGYLAMLIYVSRRASIAWLMMMWRLCTIFYLVALPLSTAFLAVMAYFQGTFDWRSFVLVGGGGFVSVAVIVWVQSHVSINLATAALLQRVGAVDSDHKLTPATGRRLLRKLRELLPIHRLLFRLQGQSLERVEALVAGLPEERTPESALRFRPRMTGEARTSETSEQG